MFFKIFLILNGLLSYFPFNTLDIRRPILLRPSVSRVPPPPSRRVPLPTRPTKKFQRPGVSRGALGLLLGGKIPTHTTKRYSAYNWRYYQTRRHANKMNSLKRKARMGIRNTLESPSEFEEFFLRCRLRLRRLFITLEPYFHCVNTNRQPLVRIQYTMSITCYE